MRRDIILAKREMKKRNSAVIERFLPSHRYFENYVKTQKSANACAATLAGCSVASKDSS